MWIVSVPSQELIHNISTGFFYLNLCINEDPDGGGLVPRVLRSPMFVLTVGFLLAIGLGFLIFRFGQAAPVEVGLEATAVLVAPSGNSIGTAKFRQAASGVLVAVEANGLEPGGHSVIVHEVGSCTPDFSAAGDHFNPGDSQHGFVHSNWSRRDPAGGVHGGDLPNIYAAADGTARADYFTDGITLQADADHSVFDTDGSAIIIHEKPDLYGEVESDTGERVACGVIQPG